MVETTPVAQFEALLRQLHQTVTRLEQETLTLDEAIAAYEQCVALARDCSEMLDRAELRVAQIDSNSRSLREQAAVYRFEQSEASRLLLGEDDDDLADLLGEDEP
jgi:exodeoxyribonuclease VII small subunit